MIVISKNNKQIAEIIKMKNTDKSIFFLDTPKLIHEAILAGVEILHILRLETFCDDELCAFKNVEIIVTEKVLNSISSVKTNAGIVAVCRFLEKPPQIHSGNFLVLDNIQDPGNFGTLIRGALGADFLCIYALDCVKKTNDKVVRSSMGTIFRENIYEIKKEDFIKFCKEKELNLICCDMLGENLFEYEKKSDNVGLVLGNEGQGVSKELKELCKETVMIPMKNNLESLNVAVSGNIIMYYINFGG